MGNSSPNLHGVLSEYNIQETLLRLSPSLPVRLRRVARAFSDLFTDSLLTALLPKCFEALGLYHSNPFTLCAIGDVESFWLMLALGIDPRITDSMGESLLQCAIRGGSVPIVHMLLERGYSVSSKGAYGYTPLHQVAYTSNLTLCEFLLDQGGNLDALSTNGSTPLLVACREGQIALVECMLRYGADPVDGGDKGVTPLMIAAAEGHDRIIQLLVEYGANINEPTTFELRTPLHEAVEGGHIQTCMTILQLGGTPSITALDADGASPIDVASALCRPDIADLLKTHASISPLCFSPKRPDKKPSTSPPILSTLPLPSLLSAEAS